jgi:hypothetical protein
MAFSDTDHPRSAAGEFSAKSQSAPELALLAFGAPTDYELATETANAAFIFLESAGHKILDTRSPELNFISRDRGELVFTTTVAIESEAEAISPVHFGRKTLKTLERSAHGWMSEGGRVPETHRFDIITVIDPGGLGERLEYEKGAGRVDVTAK